MTLGKTRIVFKCYMCIRISIQIYEEKNYVPFKDALWQAGSVDHTLKSKDVLYNEFN